MGFGRCLWRGEKKRNERVEKKLNFGQDGSCLPLNH